MRHKFEAHEKDKNQRTLHIDSRVPKYHEYLSEKLSTADQEFIDKLKAVPGVTKIWSEHYSLSFTKGSVFEWSEIEPKVLAVVKARYGANGECDQFKNLRDYFARCSAYGYHGVINP